MRGSGLTTISRKAMHKRSCPRITSNSRLGAHRQSAGAEMRQVESKIDEDSYIQECGMNFVHRGALRK